MANIGEFRKQKRNANRHTERGLKLLSESVDRDGWIGALTVAADGETFDGSARLVTAQQDTTLEPIVVHTNGDKPVIVVRDDIPTADDPKAKRLGVMANHVTATDWEPDAAILAEIAKDDAVIAALANEDARLAELLKDKPHTLDHTMSKGYFEDGERSDNYKKLCYRIEAAWKANAGTAVEMFAGQGHLSYWYKRRFERVVTVDKAKYDGVDYVMPCERFIAEKLQDYQDFDFVDFDDEGSPAEQIKLFFDSIPWRSRGFGLAFTDGILNTLHVRGPWTPRKYLIGDSERGTKGTAEDYERCEEIVKEFIEKLAAPRFKTSWLALERNSKLTAVYGTCFVEPV